MSSPPDKSKLKELAIGAEAAYVCTPAGIFYVNKAIDECTTLTFSSEQFKLFEKEAMSPKKENKLLTQEDLNKIKLMTGHRHVRSIKLDLTCCDDEGSLEQALMKSLYQRDFQHTAAAMQLTPGLTQFKIIGIEGAINAIKQGLISAVNEKTIFNDLIQLYRLAKIRLKYPNKCFLLSIGEQDLSTIAPAILEKAKCSNRAILIRKNQNEFFIYGDKKGDGFWGFTKVTAESSRGLDTLPFQEGIVKCMDVQFNQVTIIRAVKEGHANPMFFMDQKLATILKLRDFNKQFNDFIFSENHPENITHLRQINTKLDDLFDSFADTESVMEVLCELPIIQGMTGIADYKAILDTAPYLGPYMETLPTSYKKTAFYLFMDINVCFLSDRSNIKTGALISNVTQTLELIHDAPKFTAHVNYLRENSVSRSMRRLPLQARPDKAFMKMMGEIRYYHFAPQSTPEATQGENTKNSITQCPI